MNNRTKSVDWYYTESNPSCKTPKTTTQEMLEAGGLLGGIGQKISIRKQLNFQSYPISEADVIKKRKEAEKRKVEITTSYKRDYMEHYPPICKQKPGPEFTPDPLFNRKPLSDFPSTEASAFKFMDDHFINLSENRKKINVLRQLRNSGNVDSMKDCTVDWYYTEPNPNYKTPKTTTQDMLEKGILAEGERKSSFRRQLNFQSYPITKRDGGFKQIPKKVGETSTYRRDYRRDYIPTPPASYETPHPLFNRKPAGKLPITDVTNFKFMDDHLVNLSEAQKEMDFFRQLSTAHHHFI
uniref:Uncharacterized protein n=1 Tax=Glossina pallidipes TaxID=7398 RepID=A0A1B0A0R8_GLOPL